jgi:hypothetical protein
MLQDIIKAGINDAVNKVREALNLRWAASRNGWHAGHGLMLGPLERLIKAIGRLPGIGKKSATRLGFSPHQD